MEESSRGYLMPLFIVKKEVFEWIRTKQTTNELRKCFMWNIIFSN